MKRFFNILGCISILIAENASEAFYSAFQYRNIGPTRGGRVTAVTGVIKTHGTFYMGQTGGGVWSTNHFGIEWQNID